MIKPGTNEETTVQDIPADLERKSFIRLCLLDSDENKLVIAHAISISMIDLSNNFKVLASISTEELGFSKTSDQGKLGFKSHHPLADDFGDVNELLVVGLKCVLKIGFNGNKIQKLNSYEHTKSGSLMCSQLLSRSLLVGTSVGLLELDLASLSVKKEINMSATGALCFDENRSKLWLP